MKPQIHGLLFTTDFLNEGVRQTPGWNASENDFIIFRDEIKKISAALQNTATLRKKLRGITPTEYTHKSLHKLYFHCVRLIAINQMQNAYVF